MSVSSSEEKTFLSYIDQLIPLFQRTIALENITRPKISEYDALIDEYHNLTLKLVDIQNRIETEKPGKPKQVMSDMVNSMIDCADAAEAYWQKLKGKALHTEKYGFFENSRDMSNLRRLIKIRQSQGKELNMLRNVLEAKLSL